MAATLVAAGLAAPCAQSQGLTRDPVSNFAVTPDEMERRLEAAAQREQRDLPRSAQIDFTWPFDAEEYRALNKHNVVLIVALTQNAGELPIRRCYIRGQGADLVLRKLSSNRGTVAPDSPVRRLGTYREDSFYVAPSVAMARPGTLLCDFAVNRSDFLVYQLPSDAPEFLRTDPYPEAGPLPPLQAVRRLIAREYVGFPLPK